MLIYILCDKHHKNTYWHTQIITEHRVMSNQITNVDSFDMPHLVHTYATYHNKLY